MKGIEPAKGEIVMYQPDETIRLEVLVENKCGELKEQNTCSILEHMGNDGKQLYVTKYYNLDAIISVGFRVFGASLKDAGKKLFAYIRMQETSATELLSIIR